MTQGFGQNMDFGRFQNLTKIVYAKRVSDLTPDGDELAKECSFTNGERLGDEYHMPVTLTREGGVTFNADGSVFALNKPRARVTEKAKLRGNELLLRSAMSYAVMNRAMTGTGSKEGDRKAFVNATKDTFVNLTKSASYFRELGILYGGGAAQTANLGKIATVSAAGTVLTLTLTTDSWCTGVWAGSEGLEYDFYDTTATTKKNTLGTDAAGDNVYRLTSLNPLTRTLVFSSIAGNVTAAAIGDIILFAGAFQKEQLGIEGACRATALLWGINVSSYYLWKPQTLNVNGQLTFEKILAGTAKSASVGFEGTLNVHVNPYTWQDLADDQAALVRHTDKGGGKVTMGYNSIEYVGQTGKMRIKPNKYVKQGLAFGLPDGNCMRVGSTDLTFEQPGFGRMLRELENAAGIEARIYMDNAFFCDLPGALIMWTGIVNSSSSAT
jgi:hypothetical protein